MRLTTSFYGKLGIRQYLYLLSQYFACLIFVGNGRRQKRFNGENFLIYGMSTMQHDAVTE